MIILGIDPGTASGALAALNDGEVLLLADLPVHVLPAKGHAARTTLDVAGLHLMIAELGPIEHCFLELVGPMPRQGIVSTWRFAESYGAIRAVVTTMGIPHTLVRPVIWQKHHGIGAGADAARRRSVELYPAAAPLLARKRDANRADALLIAHYGQTRLLRPASVVSPDAARRRAGELYPDAAPRLTRKADAILIAHAGLQRLHREETA